MSEPRLRILVLLPFPPDPDGLHGGARVAGQLLEALAERHEIGALYLEGRRDAPLPGELRRRLAFAEPVSLPDLESTAPRRGVRLVRRGAGIVRGRPAWATDAASTAFASRLSAVVREWRPDVVQAEYHVMGQYLGASAGAPRVLVEYEPGAAAAVERMRAERGLAKLLRLLDAAAWRRWERRLLALPDAVVVFTEEDRRALVELLPAVHVERIAPGVPLPPAQLDPLGATPPRILYVGSFIHPPNVRAAGQLARRIFPIVRARCPDALLEIVGDEPPPEILRLGGDGISVVGRVEDMQPYLARAAVVAVPLEAGGGIRVKLMEALAAGKAVVATPRALSGLEVVSGRHVLVGTTDEELAAALVALLADPGARVEIARAGRAWALAHLGWTDVVTRYEALYDRLPARGAASG